MDNQRMRIARELFKVTRGFIGGSMDNPDVLASMIAGGIGRKLEKYTREAIDDNNIGAAMRANKVVF